MINKIADSVIKYPWFYIILFLGITGLFASQLPKAQIDPSVKNQLPADMPARINQDKIEEIFGGTDIMMAVVSAEDVLQSSTLKRIKKISKQMERIKEFDKILSLYTLKDIQGQNGEMIVDPAVKRIPRNDKQREKLRADLKDNDLIYGAVVSKDFKHTAIIGFMNQTAADKEVLEKVQKVLNDNPGPEEVQIAGMPFVRTHLSADIRGDMQKFLPFGLLLMLVFLFFCFKQLRGVLLPFIMTIMAIIVSMGMIPMLGWKIQMVTVILPVILIAVANDYGIHMLSRYQEDNSPDKNTTSKELAKEGIVNLAKPVLATGITTIAGLLCLLSHIIVPAEQMGILASVGVLFALSGSLLFIPAILAVLPKAKPLVVSNAENLEKASILDKSLKRLAEMVTANPKTILISLLVIVILTSTGIYVLKIDTNPANYYPEDAVVAKASNLVDREFGGASAISIVAKGDIKDPKIMNDIDKFEKHLKAHPKIDITSSIAKVVRQMNEVMHDGDPKHDSIPDKRNTIAQYFLLYSMSGDPDDFDRLVDFPYEHAQVSARVNDGSTSAMMEVVEYVHEYLENTKDHPFTVVGGFVDFFSDLVEKIVNGQLISLALSLLLVGLLVGLLFRSFVAGLMAVIPLVMSMMLLFGLMGYLKIELNIATAMLSSIMIGVGVDYTIHYLWRYKAERSDGHAPAQAVIRSLTTTGRGIVFNAMSVVIGFAVLILSAFLPIRFFGILVTVSISACLIGALVVLPAICIIAKPAFLEPKQSK